MNYTGDAALIAIAHCIKRYIHERDCAGRIGGEEFAIFLGIADETEVRAVAESIRAEVELKSAEGAQVPLSVSIGGGAGVAAGTVKGHFRAADRWLYEAKRRGRNCVSVRSPVKSTA